jgi:trans-aconitate methyltransferase
VYSSKSSEDVSWSQREPSTSLRLIDLTGPSRESCVIDVGGGDSRRVDALLERGMACVTVIDVSRSALERAKARLGDLQRRVRWVEADVTGEWNAPPVDIWHDRAVFHFLTDEEDRRKYVARLRQSLKPGSGLPVMQHSTATLSDELGSAFVLVDSVHENHLTPAGRSQAFCFALFRHRR